MPYHAAIVPQRQPAFWGASHAENPHAIDPASGRAALAMMKLA
jgi:hypothetical protein